MIRAWRLSRAKYKRTAMSGEGGLYVEGRWHSRGVRIVYASSSLALATLEVFVNLKYKSALSSFVQVEIGFAEHLCEPISAELYDKFKNDPDHKAIRTYGDHWLSSQRSCILAVPSRVIRGEDNYLINPLHPDFSKVSWDVSDYTVDPRLLGDD